MSAATLERNVQYILDRFEIQDVLARMRPGKTIIKANRAERWKTGARFLHPMLSLTTPRPDLLSGRSAPINNLPKSCAEPQSVRG